MSERAPLTAKQAKVLAFVADYITGRGEAPTSAEIAQKFGWSSINGAHEHVAALVRKGYLRRRRSGGGRNIALVDPEVAAGPLEDAQLQADRRAPIVDHEDQLRAKVAALQARCDALSALVTKDVILWAGGVNGALERLPASAQILVRAGDLRDMLFRATVAGASQPTAVRKL